MEEEERGWRRRKGGGVGGVCKKWAKYKVQQMGKCSYVSSINITKAGHQKVSYIVAAWFGNRSDLFAGSGAPNWGRGAVRAAPPGRLAVCLSSATEDSHPNPSTRSFPSRDETIISEE